MNLKPSRDVVPYPLVGRLYEASVTTNGIVGSSTPQLNNFLARVLSGADYRVLSNVSTLSGAPLGARGTASGNSYFDVVGENPDSVIYNSGFEDLLGWVGLQPIESAEVVPGSNVGGRSSSDGSSSSGSASTENGGSGVPGSTGPNEATPPNVSNGDQNGPYGPSGSTPPVGDNS